jgi:2-oxoglutarate ferredoxin oxidoreductase subunit gamma
MKLIIKTRKRIRKIETGVMMARTEVKFAGFGGQGIVLSGFILGRAVSIYEDKQAVLTQSYGPEARGGACAAEIVLSDTIIDYPYVSLPEILVLMSQEAHMIYHEKITDDGIVLYDTGLVHLNKNEKATKIYGIPATKIAEELGKRIVANIVMLGFFTTVTGAVTKEAMTEAVKASVPAGLLELNMQALEKGFQHGEEAVKA